MRRYVLAALALVSFSGGAYSAAPQTINHMLSACGCCDADCDSCDDC